MLCASAIFRLAEEDDSRDLVRLHGGLELLIDLISDIDNQGNKELMAAVTGAIWKCSTANDENVERFQELELMHLLIQLLRDNSDALDDLQFNPQKMAVLTNVVGAMAECTVTQANIDIIKTEDGLVPLIRLISTNGPELLVNVSRALGECANDKDALERMVSTIQFLSRLFNICNPTLSRDVMMACVFYGPFSSIIRNKFRLRLPGRSPLAFTMPTTRY